MTSKATLSPEQYRDERKMLIEVGREGARTFDKGILTLSAAALGLSFTLLKSYPPHAGRRSLVMSWGGFILSILANLVSQLTSQKRTETLLDELEGHQEKKERNGGRGPTPLLNWVSILAFTTGVIALAVFSSELLP